MPAWIWPWIGFNIFVVAMLAIDLGVFHRKAHVVSLREAGIWSAVWISQALLFNAGVFILMGSQKGMEFLTGYVIEKSLSVDNIFVFAIIFSYFSVPAQYQHRVLFYGILGALVMRAIFIAAGLGLLELFHWIIYPFGAFLVLMGFRMLTQREAEVHPERNPLLRLARRFFPVTPNYVEQRFFVRQGAKWMVTPLLLVLIVVETTDVVFAVDSIPAVIAITRDPFIVYTSNVFAILGLRALYFLLAGVMRHFRYLKVGLSMVLCFVGVKMMLADIYKLPTYLALGAIAAILGAAILASLIAARREEQAQARAIPGVSGGTGHPPDADPDPESPL
jgi:tellurite resistance protein TerC